MGLPDARSSGEECLASNRYGLDQTKQSDAAVAARARSAASDHHCNVELLLLLRNSNIETSDRKDGTDRPGHARVQAEMEGRIRRCAEHEESEMPVETREDVLGCQANGPAVENIRQRSEDYVGRDVQHAADVDRAA